MSNFNNALVIEVLSHQNSKQSARGIFGEDISSSSFSFEKYSEDQEDSVTSNPKIEALGKNNPDIIYEKSITSEDKSRQLDTERSLIYQSARTPEAISLLKGLGMECLDIFTARVAKYNPATLIGSGSVENIKSKIEREKEENSVETDLIFIDYKISPLQQRNLEKEFGLPIWDRTQVILQVFSQRARTHEGRIQVELAQEVYQRSRLVRTWTHLERQRGGFGFMGGPGEKQLEVDRRLADKKIKVLQNKIAKIRNSRELRRYRRSKTGSKVISLAGYTNSGKSTLFNMLSDNKVYADNIVFATLDPTIRELRLGAGKSVSIIDTVGFISELPTELVASFQATLEEIVGSDFIIHVHDIAQHGWQDRCAEVEANLEKLGIDTTGNNIINALNKIDSVTKGKLSEAKEFFQQRGYDQAVLPVSAIRGDGISAVIDEITNLAYSNEIETSITLSPQLSGKILAWLHVNVKILSQISTDEGGVIVNCLMAEKTMNQISKRWPAAVIGDLSPKQNVSCR